MNRDYTITSIETITAFNFLTGAYRWTLDEIQSASIAQGEETTPITGKQGREISTIKKNKSVTVSGANGLISGGLYETQTGGKFTNEVTEVLWIDYLTVSSNKASTRFVAVGTEGAEIIHLSVKNENDVVTGELTQDATAAEGKFAYDPSTKELTFSGIDDGTEIAVQYNRKIQADVLENRSDTFSEKCELYIDVLAEDKCGNIYRGQYHFPKSDFSGQFTLDFGDNQTVHSFEAKALAGACGAGGNFYKFTLFGVNAEDVA